MKENRYIHQDWFTTSRPAALFFYGVYIWSLSKSKEGSQQSLNLSVLVCSEISIIIIVNTVTLYIIIYIEYGMFINQIIEWIPRGRCI